MSDSGSGRGGREERWEGGEVGKGVRERAERVGEIGG